MLLMRKKLHFAKELDSRLRGNDRRMPDVPFAAARGV